MSHKQSAQSQRGERYTSKKCQGQETSSTSANQRSLHPSKSTQERIHRKKKYIKTVKVDAPGIGHLDNYTV